MIYRDNYEINNQNTSRYFGYSEDYFVHFPNDIRKKLINSYINFLINKKTELKNNKYKITKAQQIISLEELSEIIKREEEKKAKIKVLMRR